MPSKSLRKAIQLYLLRDDSYDSILQQFENEVLIPFANNLEIEGYVIPIQDQPEPPQWADAVEYLTNSDFNQLLAQRPGAIIILKFNGNSFAITFGTGWHKLQIDWYELNFGKLVALNIIPFNQLSGIKIEEVLSSWHQSTEKSPLPTSARTFGLEASKDLVHGIEGQPIAQYSALFGAKVVGGDALHFVIDFHNIKNVLAAAIERFQSVSYKDIWPEFNYISIVKHTKVAELDAELDTYLNNENNIEKLVLNCPTFRRGDIESPYGYWIGRKKHLKNGDKHPSMPYLYPSVWKKVLDKLGVQATVSAARTTKVHLFNEALVDYHEVRLYDCISHEVQVNDEVYLLSSGIWFEISTKFIDRVNDGLQHIVLSKQGGLIGWDGSEEGKYNKDCASNNPDLILLDAKNIMFGGGQSKFELCDLYNAKTNTLYFVKNVTGSSQFSHFSEQVRRSVELIFDGSPEFRNAAKEKFKAIYPEVSIDWLSKRPKRNDLKICLVSLGKPYTEYPFFAKSSLVSLIKDLDHLGHEVEFEIV